MSDCNYIDCKHCGKPFPRQDRGSISISMRNRCSSQGEVISLSPICQDCADNYIEIRKTKYHDDYNINSICIWLKMRELNTEICLLKDYGNVFCFNIGLHENMIQLPKISAGAPHIAPGFLFDKLDELARKHMSSRKKNLVLTT